MKRFAVKIAYLGSLFSGSQAQPGLYTVESAVRRDLGLVLKTEDPDLKFSSRTDKGVNSLGNTIVFYSPMEDGNVLLKALNSVSESIFYRSWCEVGEDFNVRYASRRIYKYVLFGEFDMQIVEKCCRLFEGTHDFSSFCHADGRSTTVTIDRISCIEKSKTIVLEFEARYYLWNMIRRISAAIGSAGSGKTEITEIAAALDGKRISFGTGRPDALTLIDVQYDFLEFAGADPRGFSGRRDENARDAYLKL